MEFNIRVNFVTVQIFGLVKPLDEDRVAPLIKFMTTYCPPNELSTIRVKRFRFTQHNMQYIIVHIVCMF